MDQSYVSDELFLLTVKGESPQDHAQLVQAAAQVWTKIYGHARVGSCADGKLHRRRRTADGGAIQKPGTLRAWTQKRRADVDCIVEQERAKKVPWRFMPRQSRLKCTKIGGAPPLPRHCSSAGNASSWPSTACEMGP